MADAEVFDPVRTGRELAKKLVGEYYDHRAEYGRDDLVLILAMVREMRAGFGDLAKDVEQDLLAQAGEKRFVVPGVGECEVRKSVRRTRWDNDGLTRKLVALALDERVLDEETGEYEPAYEAVARVLSECSRPSWRVTPLRARHIQIDEWCEEHDDGWSVTIPSVR